jgi:hypothetical protein
MTDLLKTALLLEEKADSLPRDSSRRTHLLGIAKAARQIALAKAAGQDSADRAQSDDADGARIGKTASGEAR